MDYAAAMQSLWKDRCDVIIHVSVTDPVTKITDFVDETALTAEPCKISFETLTSTDGGEVAAVAQAVKLFLSPAVTIPPGSKIVVTSNGRTTAYSQSGLAALYSAHQEIPLKLFRGWA